MLIENCTPLLYGKYYYTITLTYFKKSPNISWNFAEKWGNFYIILRVYFFFFTISTSTPQKNLRKIENAIHHKKITRFFVVVVFPSFNLPSKPLEASEVCMNKNDSWIQLDVCKPFCVRRLRKWKLLFEFIWII